MKQLTSYNNEILFDVILYVSIYIHFDYSQIQLGNIYIIFLETYDCISSSNIIHTLDYQSS